MSDPEDILSVSLETLYDYRPITLTSAGSVFTYTIPSTELTVSVKTPDTEAANWSLHASSIWISSVFFVEHIHEYLPSSGLPMTLLELGAGAGLPGISIAKAYPNVDVTVSDYPDTQLMETLSANVALNDVPNCKVVPHIWGTDTSTLGSFDRIICADLLWNPEMHASLVASLLSVTNKNAQARVHLIAGLHTGRWTIQAFLSCVCQAGFVIDCAMERESGGPRSRPWDISRADGEDEKERRRWVVCLTLKWR